MRIMRFRIACIRPITFFNTFDSYQVVILYLQKF